MKAILDHVGIAVKDLRAALAFYRDALGLEIEPPEEVPSERVRAHFIPVGGEAERGEGVPAQRDQEVGAPGVRLELLEATAPDSPIAAFVEKRGPGLHHITLRVDDIAAAIAQLKARGARLIDERPRPGAEGSLAAFIHPSAAHGVLIELKQSSVDSRQSTVDSRQSTVDSRQSTVVSRQSTVVSRQSTVDSRQSTVDSRQSTVDSRQSSVDSRRSTVDSRQSTVDSRQSTVDSRQSSVAASTQHHAASVSRHALGDLELISVCDGFFSLDGGSMFGVVPKMLWSAKAPPDERNRITLAMRPLVVRGARTMIIDAGVGDKENAKFSEIYGLDRERHLDHTLAEAGLAAEDIDIVLASHLHFDHAGGFTMRDSSGRVRPRFPRAQYIVRRGEWKDATHPNERNRASYFADNYVPLADAGVLQLVDDDQAIMPGVRVRRTGGHTMHHQIVLLESGGKAAAFVADLIPTTAHVPNAWIMGYDLYPLDTLAAKKAFAQEAIDRDMLVFFEHDPSVAAGYIREEDGKRRVVPAAGSSAL